MMISIHANVTEKPMAMYITNRLVVDVCACLPVPDDRGTFVAVVSLLL